MASWQKALAKGRAIATGAALFFREVAIASARDRINLLGAALAYYGIFSIGPLVYLVVNIAGLVYGVELAERQALEQVRTYAGAPAAETLASLLHATHLSGGASVAAWVSGASLVAGAAGMFALIHDALNIIWEVTPLKGGRPLARAIRTLEKYLLAVVAIVVVGLLLLASIVLGTLMEAFHVPLDLALPGGVGLWLSLNEALSLGIVTVAFALMFRHVPDTVVSWRHAWLGASTTTLLFGLGKYALSFYLARSNAGALYGAAGSILALLVWIFYSAESLFVGAEFAKVMARREGPP
ncbi:MAG TPA: YihY/virulence factor BrkB family protein [Pantanalinema sp.]